MYLLTGNSKYAFVYAYFAHKFSFVSCYVRIVFNEGSVWMGDSSLRYFKKGVVW